MFRNACLQKSIKSIHGLTYHVVVSNLFQMTIHNGITKLVHCLIPIFFVCLSFFIGNGLADDLLFVQVSANGFKVALFEFLDNVATPQDCFEIGKEVLDKNLGRLGISQVHSVWIHGGEKSGSATNELVKNET